MAVRGGWRPLSGLICEIVNSVGQEILHLSGKSQGKVREFQTPMAVATMSGVSLKFSAVGQLVFTGWKNFLN